MRLVKLHPYEEHADKIKAAGFVPIDGVMGAYVTASSKYAALLASQLTIITNESEFNHPN